MKPTDSFEVSPSSEEYKQSIIGKIEDDLEKVKNQLDSPIRSYERRKLRGKHLALEQLKVKIDAIQENSGHTDNKFLNAAYFQARVIRDTGGGLDGKGASSPEGESGKREAMSEIMTYIKYL